MIHWNMKVILIKVVARIQKQIMLITISPKERNFRNGRNKRVERSAVTFKITKLLLLLGGADRKEFITLQSFPRPRTLESPAKSQRTQLKDLLANR